MKAETVLTAVVAVCCVLAIGATSTTLDATVSTDPDDVAEVDYDRLPIGTGAAETLDDAIDGGRSAAGESGASSDDSSSGGSSDGSGSKSTGSRAAEDGSRTGQGSSSGDGQQRDQRSEPGDDDQQAGGGSSDQQNQGGAGGSNSQSGTGGATVEPPSLLDRLLSLLRDLLDLLLRFLPYLVVGTVLIATVRYRDRLLSRAAPSSLAGEDGDDTDLDPSPENEVAAAWFEMVERLDLGDRRDLTPRECAAAARRRGVDAEPAQTLTALFEEVRYGGARVTDERRRRAERNLDRVRSQLEGRQ